MNLLQSGILSQEEFAHEKALLEKKRYPTGVTENVSSSGSGKDKRPESLPGGSGSSGGPGALGAAGSSAIESDRREGVTCMGSFSVHDDGMGVLTGGI